MPICVKSPPEASGLATPLAALVRVALRLEGRRAGDITVVLADDDTLRGLNRRWRGLDRATDVLSFDYGSAGNGVASGDLVVSLDRMDAQARRYRVSRGRELARLVVHGALHLAGLDHHRRAERGHMRSRERAVLRASAGAIGRLERALDRVKTRSPRARRVRATRPAR